MIGGKAYFAANDGTTGNELWVTDGTLQGTKEVADINKGAGSSNPVQLFALGGTLYFDANNGKMGAELYKLDVNSGVVSLIKDINPGAGGSVPWDFTAIGNTVFFSATDGTSGTELWKTDGTAAGTKMVEASSGPNAFIVVGKTIYFRADDGTHGSELWVSDGSVAGTKMVADINQTPAGAGNAGSLPAFFTSLPGMLVFSANDGNVGRELWRYTIPQPRVDGRVWDDPNGNGIQDASESGHATVAVQLLDANSNVVATTTSDSQGNYSFTNLTPGTYFVQFVSPSGYVFTADGQGQDDTLNSDANPSTGETAALVLDFGQDAANVDAGLVPQNLPYATINGSAWLDANNNGIQDPGEAQQPGVMVQLLDPNLNVLATTGTDVNGQYSFTQLPAGSYYLRFSTPPGFAFATPGQGSDADPSTGLTPLQTVSTGQVVNAVDAGLVFIPATISGDAWNDANDNGIQDPGESGQPGMVVQLLDSNGNIVSTMTTGGSGQYSFNQLTPGGYYVQFVAAAGQTFTIPGSGSMADPSTGSTPLLSLSPGQTMTSVNAGLIPAPTPGTVNGSAWTDANGNGLQDPGESGRAGVTVQLLDTNLNVLATTTTDSDGQYSFAQVAPGSYYIQFAPPSGEAFTTQGQGSVVDPTDGRSSLLSVSPGQALSSIDAGLIQTTAAPATVSGRAWSDPTADGVQSLGQPGIAGVPVYLFNQSGILVASTLTDANGAYSFTVIASGTYTVQFGFPGVFAFSPEYQGSDQTADSDVNAGGFTDPFWVALGQNLTSLDAGITNAM